MTRVKTYAVKEIFYSLQGEGARAGSANVFLRFAGCNLQCEPAVEGFLCDTDFKGGERMTLDQIMEAIEQAHASADGIPGVILTGGEPALQVTKKLVTRLRRSGYLVCMETNGMVPCSWAHEGEWINALDWVSCSPKAGRPPVIQVANEVRVVVGLGGRLDCQGIKADHYFASPAFAGIETPGEATTVNPRVLGYVTGLCLEDPAWRLSVQQHKVWGVR